jgi:peptidoglycan/xylan/chitin deacetylase (PgdA/CDA1 family)
MEEGSRHDPVSRIGRAGALWFRRSPVTIAPQRPLVSFTFDDVPDSAITNGARLLSERGCRGTFYLAGGLADATYDPWRFFSPDDVGALLDAGHEVGCHTHSHAIVQTLSKAELASEFERNAAWLRELDQRVSLKSFAYPYGAVGFMRKRQAANRFATCRGVRHGLNVGSIDRAQLRAVQLYDCRLDDDGLDRIIAEAVEKNAWLIFYTHDVQADPSEHGCSPQLLERAIDRVLASGCDVLPVGEAFESARAAPR